VKTETQNLEGVALDYAVALANDQTVEFSDPLDPWIESGGIVSQPLHSYTPSTDWHQGGAIIERERLQVSPFIDAPLKGWTAHRHDFLFLDDADPFGGRACCVRGSTPLVAAMRCYVMSKLGHAVEIPETLTK